MFKRFRRSIRDSSAKSDENGAPHHVCHECGQSLRDTIDTIDTSYANNAAAGQFNSNRASKRDSWNGSSSSDSGYGSSRHSELEAQLDLSDDLPAPSIPLPRRRPTYNSSIYSETSTFDQTHRQEIIVEEPVHIGPPVYDHLFDLPPRTFTNYSEKWKPKSRYSRLNELPAASPRAMAFPDDVLDVNSGAEEEQPVPTEKKRMSLVLRPSSLRRLASRRSKSH